MLTVLSEPAVVHAFCRRCHIAVGTPGRVGSLLEAGTLQPSAMKMLVLDEADQLMTESFAEDVRCAAAHSINTTMDCLLAMFAPMRGGLRASQRMQGSGAPARSAPLQNPSSKHLVASPYVSMMPAVLSSGSGLAGLSQTPFSIHCAGRCCCLKLAFRQPRRS